MFFEKRGPVWETLHKLQHRLNDAGVEYIVIGGLALNVYNYPRQTIDVNIVLRPEDYEKFKNLYEQSVYNSVKTASRRFVDPESGVTIDILVAGELAGRRSKNHSVRFPDPAEAEEHDELATVSLSRLIELKLVTWRFKDWGDVVELIRRNGLPESFADDLNPVVRTAFGECFDQAHDEEYDPPGGQKA